MKRFSKIICVMLVMACCIVNVNVPVYAEGVSARTILRYQSSAYSDSGRIKVFVDLSVQDSNSTIIGYQIAKIATGYGVTNANVINSTITNNSTQVYVLVEYYYGSNYIIESVYVDM
ncbi:MAG: hypothetical protein PUF12_02025 [Thermoflexaceae bacterium]|nr:hypothetical protein [Thermoflexaceae bacterium]